MNWAHIHLLLNHAPVVGAVFAALLLAFALWRGTDELRKVGLGALVVVGLAAGVVYLTGEPAEEMVEHLAGISEAALERHEEAALAATVVAGAVAALALAALVFFRRRRLPTFVAALVLMGNLALIGTMGWTANLGGQIRHSEITSASAGDPAPQQAHAEHGDHD